MKKISTKILGAIVLLAIFAFTYQNNPWTDKQIIEPADLAKILEGPSSKHPVVFNIGTMPLIKNASFIGLGNSTHGINKFKEAVSKLDKNKMVVIYCGCCTMDNCPNIRTPFEHLKAEGFTNAKILNIKVDLNVDWINKGYPMN